MASLSSETKWNFDFDHKVAPKLFWEWDLPYGNDCAICRKSIMELSAKAPDRSTCAPVIGKCGHAFHKDCIKEWIKNRNHKCPICKKRWEIKQIKELNPDLKEKNNFLNNMSNLLKDIPDDIRKEITTIFKSLDLSELNEDKKEIIEQLIKIAYQKVSEDSSSNLEESVHSSSNITEEEHIFDDMPELESANSDDEIEDVN